MTARSKNCRLSKSSIPKTVWCSIRSVEFFSSSATTKTRCSGSIERLLSTRRIFSAHYNLMLSYRGLNDTEASAREEKLYLRFKADETAQTRTGEYRLKHPIDNNERQPIHMHESSS